MAFKGFTLFWHFRDFWSLGSLTFFVAKFSGCVDEFLLIDEYFIVFLIVLLINILIILYFIVTNWVLRGCWFFNFYTRYHAYGLLLAGLFVYLCLPVWYTSLVVGSGYKVRIALDIIRFFNLIIILDWNSFTDFVLWFLI